MKAFPRADGKFNSAIKDEQGMDLRDWFAGQVLPKLIGGAEMKDIAEAAYKWADEMMKAREQ